MLRRLIIALLICSVWADGAHACNGLAFNGTTASAVSSGVLTLGAATKWSTSFWLKVTTFDNTDELAYETTVNSNNTAGAFVFDPNSSTFTGKFHAAGHNASSAISAFTRPSGAAWHHYVITTDTSQWGATPFLAWVDGATDTATNNTTAAGGTTSDQLIYFMSRAGASLFLAGSMANFALWTGTVLSGTDATNLFNGSSPSTIGGGPLYWWKMDSTSAMSNQGSGSAISVTATNATVDSTAPAGSCPSTGPGAQVGGLLLLGIGGN